MVQVNPATPPSSMGHPHIIQYAGGTNNPHLVSMVPCGVPVLPHNTSLTPPNPNDSPNSLYSHTLI